jgi:hypothetical protein
MKVTTFFSSTLPLIFDLTVMEKINLHFHQIMVTVNLECDNIQGHDRGIC